MQIVINEDRLSAKVDDAVLKLNQQINYTNYDKVRVGGTIQAFAVINKN